MNKIKAGNVEITEITMGAGGMGHPDKKELHFSLMDRYMELGGNCIDVARGYGGGLCERDFGIWLKERGNRNDVVISTKGGLPVNGVMHMPRLSKEELESDLNESLKMMDVDYTDIYYLHRDDIYLSVEEIMPTLHEFVKSGRVRVLGASNWTAGRIAQANEFALSNGLTPFSVSQINWSLAQTTAAQSGDVTHIIMNDVEYNWYSEVGLPIMAYSPQARGFLVTPVSDTERWEKTKKIYGYFPENYRRSERVKKLAEELQFPASAVVLAYVMNKGLAVSPIVSFSSLEQMNESMKALDIKLTDRQVLYLETGT